MEQDAILNAARQLEEWFDVDRGSAQIEMEHGPDKGVDAIIRVAGERFAVLFKSHSWSSQVWRAVDLLREFFSAHPGFVPLLIVPFMGEPGAAICREARINWLDLSGNAYVIVPGRLRIIIKGHESRYKRPGRPEDLFSPSSSRVIRWLLMHRDERPIQRAVAQAIDVSESYVGRVVKRLEEDGEVSRDNDGRLRVLNPAALLESWRASYDIHKHRVLRGYMFSRSGVELMHQLSEKLQKAGVRHAMTGLAGAWLYDQFAAFRVVSLYLNSMPDDALLRNIGFKQDDKAANVWLVLPNDMGVFDGEKVIEGVPVVHPLQVFLDLKSHAERAEDAAVHLKAEHLKWGANG